MYLVKRTSPRDPPCEVRPPKGVRTKLLRFKRDQKQKGFIWVQNKGSSVSTPKLWSDNPLGPTLWAKLTQVGSHLSPGPHFLGWAHLILYF